MLKAVSEAGIWHGYAESSVFSPNVAKAHQMVAAGGIGRLLTMRAREAHSGPHAPHFWNAETAGGGALLDMGCHTVEIGPPFLRQGQCRHRGPGLGRDDRPRRQDDRRGHARWRCSSSPAASLPSSSRPGSRRAACSYGTSSSATRGASSPIPRLAPVWGFVENPVGYMVEKADNETGWVYPVPEETRAYGFSQQMRHFCQHFDAGTRPDETFEDGVIVNRIIDACYRSMKTHAWEKVETD